MSIHEIYEVLPQGLRADLDDVRFPSSVQELNDIFDQMMRSKIHQLLDARPEIETTVQLREILNFQSGCSLFVSCKGGVHILKCESDGSQKGFEFFGFSINDHGFSSPLASL